MFPNNLQPGVVNLLRLLLLLLLGSGLLEPPWAPVWTRPQLLLAQAERHILAGGLLVGHLKNPESATPKGRFKFLSLFSRSLSRKVAKEKRQEKKESSEPTPC